MCCHSYCYHYYHCHHFRFMSFNKLMIMSSQLHIMIILLLLFKHENLSDDFKLARVEQFSLLWMILRSKFISANFIFIHSIYSTIWNSVKCVLCLQINGIWMSEFCSYHISKNAIPNHINFNMNNLIDNGLWINQCYLVHIGYSL